MAVVLGTNSGFVTVAPTVDPAGAATRAVDTYQRALKVTAPATGIITEMGWYCSAASEAANFKLGLFNWDSGNNRPGSLISSSSATAKGTTEGWKVVSGLSWNITNATDYALAILCKDTSTSTYVDVLSTTGALQGYATNTGDNFADPFGAWSGSAYLMAIYALYTTASGISIPALLVGLGEY